MMDREKVSSTFNWGWFWLLLAWGLSLAMGMLGFARYAAWHDLPTNGWDDLYLTLQLIPLNSGALLPPIPPELQAARFLIPLLTVAAAIKALLVLFSERWQRLRLRWRRGHILICGLSHKGQLLATSFLQTGRAVVIVERDPLHPQIPALRRAGAQVLIGDATDAALLRSAGLVRAEALFCVCNQDGSNAEIAITARRLCAAERKAHLVCLAHITDPQLCNLLEVSPQVQSSGFELHLFNVFEQAARQLWQEHPAWPETQTLQRAPYLVLIGLGRLGQSFVRVAAQAWSLRPESADHPLRVCVIARAARQQAALLLAHTPALRPLVEFELLEQTIPSPDFEQLAASQPSADVFYVLLDDDETGLAAGLTLARHLSGRALPIIVRRSAPGGLDTLLKEYKIGQPALHLFPYLQRACTANVLENTPRSLLARFAYQEYQRQDAAARQIAWEALSPTEQRRNFQWVDHIETLLNGQGYRLQRLQDWSAARRSFSAVEVEAMAQQEHALWQQDRLAEGWRYAPGPKDARARTHPDLLDWAQLPPAEQDKTRALILGLPEFLARAGFEARKET